MAAARKSGLGRGLEALLPDSATGAGLVMVAVDAIDPNPSQPRTDFDESALQTLAASIRDVGVLQPLVVRPPAKGGRYVLVAGERRLRAAKIAGLTEVPVVVRDGDDSAGLAEALIENLQREDLGALEEAAAYNQLMEDFGMTHEKVAERVGRSRASVSNTVRLLGLPASVQALLASNSLAAGHARALAGIDDPKFVERTAARAAAEGWSVRMVEDAVRSRAGNGRAPRRTPKERPTEIIELEERLADRLGSPVRIDYGSKGGGKLIVRFGSLDDLERIYKDLSGD